MALSREEILAGIDRRKHEVDPVEMPEWGGTVYVRKLSAAEAERTGITNNVADPEMVARVIAASTCDENGELLFSAADVEALAEADVIAAAKLFAEIVRTNGLMSDDLEEAVASFTEAQHVASSSS